MLGMFALTTQGVEGSIIQMINHGSNIKRSSETAGARAQFPSTGSKAVMALLEFAMLL